MVLLLSVACAAVEKPNIIVIFTDDQGFADIGVHGQVKDIKTPHIDALARDGITCTSGYITAPQCSPSRAGLLTGKYQQRFGFDTIPDAPLRLEEVTIAERLKEVGYTTGMVGKWHLEPNHTCVEWGREVCPDQVKGNKVTAPVELIMNYFPAAQGFDEYFKGEMNRYYANYGLDGKDLKSSGEWMDVPGYRLDIQTDAAAAFIKRNKKEPFFLYLAYFAPHVPLEATEKYLSRFPRSTGSGQAGKMPERRRYALAMMSAVDDGIGRIRELLKDLKLDENTLIFYMSDNGAPLGANGGSAAYLADVHPVDHPGGIWDGSLNTPWVGEKGMLMEGGIRVPYLVSWPARLPKGKTYKEPVISLDMAATCLAAAGQPIPKEFDGVDLVPLLAGGGKQDRALYWRFWQQTAIRKDQWKYLHLSDGRECLYDLESDRHEKDNLIAQHPEKAKALRKALAEWNDELEPKGMPAGPIDVQEKFWFGHYLNLGQ
ncbi:MAG: sulfatase [Verrucomicrobia bacterium]|nr:MAG: sulfatase [Verrucomicrobiota bacterium]